MIALIDYGMGNLSSVYNAFKAVGANCVNIVSTRKEILNSKALVLPGVGNFGDGIKNLIRLGLDDAIKEAVLAGKPFLGICLGMQLLMETSEEAPGVSGLGIIKGKTVRFSNDMGYIPQTVNVSNISSKIDFDSLSLNQKQGYLRYKIPQMGWNCVNLVKEHPYFSGLKSGEYFYFVHSYYLEPDNKDVVLGVTDYGIDFCSCIAKDNIFATQFHPEKSQDAGLLILKNFIKNI